MTTAFYYQKIIHVFSLRQCKVFFILFRIILESSFIQSFTDVRLLSLNICQVKQNVFKAVSTDSAERSHGMDASRGERHLVINGTGFIEGFDRAERKMRKGERRVYCIQFRKLSNSKIIGKILY